MSDGPPALKGTETVGAVSEAAARVGLAEPALAYDYFKSMVSLSVATLGGILTLGGTVFGARIAPWQMVVAALPVALSGLIALQGQTDITQLCQGVKPRMNSTRAALRLVPALFGMGLGVFLAFLLLSYLAPDVAARLR
ncbi:MAG: hypothetical protein Q8S03_16970 [Brevundimonas sp.]|uniref:hypothetical protein n=1 Tax=Brevundimonas sp. TaxID=1871086 RepID=UPI002732D030|nr:hypothetical protein [Brevundimonas sp.]MDP3406385.1 hypothetical protein [Brevundimonas sp.]